MPIKLYQKKLWKKWMSGTTVDLFKLNNKNKNNEKTSFSWRWTCTVLPLFRTLIGKRRLKFNLMEISKSA